ncbi:MAG: LytTR family DNA-binding domain-containing protein [Bacteroidota bacterium]
MITANYFGNPLILGRRTTVFANEVLFFEGDINYTWIHFVVPKHKKVLSKTLHEIESKINSDNFVRVSRKHLVNRKFIVEVRRTHIVLTDGSVLQISRRRRGVV